MDYVLVDSFFSVIYASDISKNDYKIFFVRNYFFPLSVFLCQR